MHHQFNHYSDSEDEDEDELPQREASVASESELDESSRPSRETTSVSTPEPSKVKGIARTIVKAATPKDEVESDEELLKDIIHTTRDEIRIPTKRKRVVDFTSSEDEAEPVPAKKHVVAQVTDAMQLDEPVAAKLSKAALNKLAKSKAAALRREKKAEVKAKTVEDSIIIETPVKEVGVIPPMKPKVIDVNLAEIEDEDNLLLDLDGVQALVRDREDYAHLIEALAGDVVEPMDDIWTWSWKQKKLKTLNFDGARGIRLNHFF
jgi:histone-lysine N-methyltransferase SETD1